jgi:hypothetical protein
MLRCDPVYNGSACFDYFAPIILPYDSVSLPVGGQGLPLEDFLLKPATDWF